jgi:hypothetical protein
MFKDELERLTDEIKFRDHARHAIRDDLARKRLEYCYLDRDRTPKKNDLPEGFWINAKIYPNRNYAVWLEQTAAPRPQAPRIMSSWIEDGRGWFNPAPQPLPQPEKILAEAFAIKVRRPARQSIISAEARCQNHLIKLMKQSPGPPQKRKTKFLDECLAAFPGLSERGFDRVWEAAKKKTGSKWGRTGRKLNERT